MNNPETTGWQPIETAPRDGTAILACCKFTGHDKPWHPDEIWADRWGPINSTEVAWQFAADEPTHWMPIPPIGDQTDG